MAERYTPAKLEIVEYECDACGKGDMIRADNMQMLSHPPQYMHVCMACSHRKSMTTSYPTTRIVKDEA